MKDNQDSKIYDDIPLFYIRKSVKTWNPTAKDCYELNCNCSKCFIYHTYFKGTDDECMMKYFVKYMLIKTGAP